ncbi:MAG: hypothetical protein U1F36_14790 [Planctomycetota bacterium]
MSRTDAQIAKILAQAMEPQGRVALAALLEFALGVDELRAMAQRHGVSPKGFRIEAAPAPKLAGLLVDPKQPKVLEATVRAFLDRLTASASEPTAKPSSAAETEALLALRNRELAEARAEVERLRAQAAEWREREAELRREAEDVEMRAARTRAELEQALRLANRREARSRSSENPDTERRVRELEREHEELQRNETEQRRLVAVRHARIRELEDRVQELLELVPKDKREKRESPKAPILADEFRIPHFAPSFYKSLYDKDRRAIEKAVQAALLFCTEGHAYPGLEVKPIEGQDLWSLRASLRLRVYFRFRPDGDVDFLALADREDQHTMLRRLKEW